MAPGFFWLRFAIENFSQSTALIEVEEFMDFAAPEVGVNQENAFINVGKTDSEVDGGGGFAFARRGTGNENCMQFLFWNSPHEGRANDAVGFGGDALLTVAIQPVEREIIHTPRSKRNHAKKGKLKVALERFGELHWVVNVNQEKR